MAPHSSTLAWKIPWMEGPDGLQSMGSLGVGHNWATSLALFTFMHWKKKWQPTPVFLPGESHGQRSLAGYSPQGCKESDTTEQLHFTSLHFEHLWHCLSLGLEWKLIFSSPVATAEFSKFAGILSAALSQHHVSGFKVAQLKFHHLQ